MPEAIVPGNLPSLPILNIVKINLPKILIIIFWIVEITSHAIAFSFPIRPSFSVVFPFIFILSLDTLHNLEIDNIKLFLIF